MSNNNTMTTITTTTTTGATASEQLLALFSACDKQGKGFIVREELRDLCSSLAIADEDSDVIFTDLDQDKDGKISYKEFSKGFIEFLHRDTEKTEKQVSNGTNGTEEREDAPEQTEGKEGCEQSERRRRASVHQAWSALTSNLPELSKSCLVTSKSGAQIKELLTDLQTSAPEDVTSRVSTVLSTLLQEIEQVQEHHKRLEVLYQKERQHHATALKSLESELEDQVAKVEQKAKMEARQESEEEKRQLQDQMEQEMAELQTHLKIFQKVDSWLKKEEEGGGDRVQEVRRKLEDAYHDNRTLNMTLHETTANLGLMRSDLAQMRLQYEEKCRELHNERETVLEYMHQYDHMKRQMELLHEANKRLQDTNDSMRSALETEWRHSPLTSRASSTRSNSLQRSKERRRSHSRSRSPHVPILSSQDSEGGLKYGIRRLMDDLDSGLSTLPDSAEDGPHSHDELKFSEPEGPMSLEEEICSLESRSPPITQAADHAPTHPTSTPSSATPSPPPIHETGTPTLKSRRTRREGSDKNASSLEHHDNAQAKVASNEVMGPPERTYKVVFAGDAAVGKSTFIVRLCKGYFVNNIASTLGVDYKVKTLSVDEKNIAIQLWDTAGQERFRSITKTYFRRADGVLLLFDVTSERSFLNVRQWIQSIDDTCQTRVPLVLCGNKEDMRATAAADGRSTVSLTEGEKLARDCGAFYIETSCKTGIGVMDALVQLARQMVTTEDVEIQTSALKVCAADQKRSCCGGRKDV
ncbi:ras and EF-hand domain-containing protein homolog isoform X1 [Portunus trituberculatus]|uniref:ras and EF-hand domain-containing protein homolog isoform X1 n=1 Tax=Portunus trituberculatus TaxID=210409 RepID=UPI001E1CB279|nr:ras and EF-hand domain-containing protein homolog isoform X1 [Portunus trituberculatus]XP_045104325.1 ras and EF-hand domain-containing protein homolog isoform X1 [Portunus trituberculatus]XP_045104326.1 ras and EF-hand domain-containing protein homolog isoform X1 [Portunus trituberculatus]